MEGGLFPVLEGLPPCGGQDSPGTGGPFRCVFIHTLIVPPGGIWGNAARCRGNSTYND
jgi:hypothetical protein